jgi:hypothetical protein
MQHSVKAGRRDGAVDQILHAFRLWWTDLLADRWERLGRPIPALTVARPDNSHNVARKSVLRPEAEFRGPISTVERLKGQPPWQPNTYHSELPLAKSFAI